MPTTASDGLWFLVMHWGLRCLPASEWIWALVSNQGSPAALVPVQRNCCLFFGHPYLSSLLFLLLDSTSIFCLLNKSSVAVFFGLYRRFLAPYWGCCQFRPGCKCWNFFSYSACLQVQLMFAFFRFTRLGELVFICCYVAQCSSSESGPGP